MTILLDKDTKVKLRRFRKDRRAYISFLILAGLFFITLPAELLCNVRPLLLVLEGRPYFPIFIKYSEQDFDGPLLSEPDYKSEHFAQVLSGMPLEAPKASPSPTSGLTLDSGDFEDNAETPPFSLDLEDFEEEPVFQLGLEDFETDEAMPTVQNVTPPATMLRSSPRDYWMIWPPIRYDYKQIPSVSLSGKVVLAAPYETTVGESTKIIPSSWVDGHYLGTDDRGRDILARLIYGFRISMIFGISLAITGTLLGCLIGGTQGFFGGWVDLIGQRLTEIWGSIPRLYILIILSSFLVPSALILFVILNLTAWMGIAAYIRAEFLKIRNYEFVKAARSMGVSNFTIMRRHILPNALTPVVTFFPFEVTAGILALVSLDYLNLGVPSPAPSIGELLAQGKNNLQAIWIILPTFAVLTLTLTFLTFVGEGIRNAFDPRKSA